MAIFGMIPLRTAPRPLYSPRAVSRLIISCPVARKPRALTCNDTVNTHDLCNTRILFTSKLTPGARARFESCIRTLIVSITYCQQRRSKNEDDLETYREDGTQELPSFQHHHRLYDERVRQVCFLPRPKCELRECSPIRLTAAVAGCCFLSFPFFDAIAEDCEGLTVAWNSYQNSRLGSN